MKISQEDAKNLTEHYNRTVSLTKKLHAEFDLFVMQSQALRALSVNISNHIKGLPDLSDSAFIYWMNIADGYFAKAAGFDALRDLRLEQVTLLTSDLKKEFEKHGITADDDNLDSVIQTLESANN